MVDFVVVAYYTPNTIYELHVKNLIESLKAQELSYKVVPVDNQGDWYKNTQYKPRFLLRMLDDLAPAPIVYVDADAVFCRYPSLFEELSKDASVDVAAYVLDHNKFRRKGTPPELLSGTLYFANNSKTREIIKLWIRECEGDPKLWDQVGLQRVLENFNFSLLPPEYCQIFDYMSSIKDPVIKHFQASRSARNNKRNVNLNKPRLIRQNGVVRIRRIHG
jgi:hypothetical protein